MSSGTPGLWGLRGCCAKTTVLPAIFRTCSGNQSWTELFPADLLRAFNHGHQPHLPAPPTPASLQLSSPHLPMPAWSQSSHITALLRSSRDPLTHRGRRPSGSQVLPHPGGASSSRPHLLLPSKGSAPATRLGCPPQGSAELTPSPPLCANAAPSSRVDWSPTFLQTAACPAPPHTEEPADPAHLRARCTCLIVLYAIQWASFSSAYPEYCLLQSRDLCPERCSGYMELPNNLTLNEEMNSTQSI